MTDAFAPPPPVRIPVRGADGTTFPVRRVYCVGRNFAEHAREMGADVPPSKADRGRPVFFMKPADAIDTRGQVPYPPGTADLHHEVEVVVGLGRDAPAGRLDRTGAAALVYGLAVGLDLTRRDLQAAAKAKGLPWDTGKAFDHSAPVGALRRIGELPPLGQLTLVLEVNGRLRQRGALADWIWDIPDILGELSGLYALKAGDMVFMGTPAGVAPLVPGDAWQARLEDAEGRCWLEAEGRVSSPVPQA